MTKEEFVERVAAKSGLGRREASEAVDAVIDSIADALRDGDEVSFTGFGKFSSSRRRLRGLSASAHELREEADELASSQRQFEARIEDSQRRLRDIANSA